VFRRAATSLEQGLGEFALFCGAHGGRPAPQFANDVGPVHDSAFAGAGSEE